MKKTIKKVLSICVLMATSITFFSIFTFGSDDVTIPGTTSYAMGPYSYTTITQSLNTETITIECCMSSTIQTCTPPSPPPCK